MNEILDVIFLACYRDTFMMIFKDGDLHRYADKLKAETGARTRRETGIPLDPQLFRPDGLLLDADGHPYILETKLSRGVSSAASHAELVVQALVYANVFLSPGWSNESTWSTYSFLNALHQAYWFVNRPFDGSCPEINEGHRDHFDLSEPLEKSQFQSLPQVIFLLERYDDQRLLNPIREIERSDFAAFAEYARNTLNRSSRLRKRINGLRANWPQLQQVKFKVMDLNTSALQSLTNEPRELI